MQGIKWLCLQTMNTGPRVPATVAALIKSLKEPEDEIGEPSPIRGNKFSHLSLEDFKETGDETFCENI
jgi:hypothetical protein